ncbi:hypothetical protein HMPREF1292_01796 [Corynebacterium sp. KPL1995]|nr:hypothetical protein HMPREF1292_01796 [Corynebacterium sp. KPL1995]ERS71303.1 hypothetical protein HMPREF1290_02084 [Corynebacterium sp. KPL1989]
MCSRCVALSAWGKTSLTRCATLDQNYFEFRGQRVRVLSAYVSHGRFGGNPGRVTIPYEGEIAVVCGSPRANVPASAIVLNRVRLDDNSELPATEFCGHRAGYI